MNLFSKKSFAIITACSVAAVFAIILIGSHTQSVDAAPINNVTGWALSDMPTTSDEILTPGNPFAGRGLGWISMTGANQNSGGGSYAVTVDSATGAFDGRAWSEYGGWLDFSPSGLPANAGTAGTATTSGARVDPTCLADITQTCAITGWIRFTGGPADPQSGGWDGWVSMSGTAGQSRSYGLVLGIPDANGVRTFTPDGYAWGDAVAGWINFKWAQVTIEIPPVNYLCEDPAAANFGGQLPCKYECPVPVPNPNYPDMGGFNSLCPCESRPGHPEDCDSTPPPDLCDNIPLIQTTTDGYNYVVDKFCAVKGCMDPDDTVNYDPDATIDDGSCNPIVCTPKSPSYNQFIPGCSPCNPTRPDYESSTGMCPKGPKKPIFIET